MLQRYKKVCKCDERFCFFSISYEKFAILVVYLSFFRIFVANLTKGI